MIHGVGTDIVHVERMREALQRSGDRFAKRILAEAEWATFVAAADPPRLLAKRFAAKEAFGKALGTGVVKPATLHSMWVEHDALGKPFFAYAPALAEHLQRLALVAHLSLSDETEYVVAYALLERREFPQAFSSTLT